MSLSNIAFLRVPCVSKFDSNASNQAGIFMRKISQCIRAILEPDIDMSSTEILKELIIGRYSFAIGRYDLKRHETPEAPLQHDDGVVQAALDAVLDELTKTGKFKKPVGYQAWKPYEALAKALGREPISYLQIARQNTARSQMTTNA